MFADGVPRIVRLLELFQINRLEQDWDAMRELLHADARLESLAAVGRVLSPDELVEAIQSATAHGLYTVRAWRPECVTEHAGLADGRVRYQVSPSAITDERRAWITTERDDQIWRMRIFRNPAAARACLAEYGLTLGL